MHTKNDMTVRERFRAIAEFKPFDRLPILEWAPWWDQTIQRWRSEGLPANLTSYDINRYFDLDVYARQKISDWRPTLPQPAQEGAGLVASMADYEAILPHHLTPEEAINRPAWEQLAAGQRRNELVAWTTFQGFFWMPRTLFGIEPHLYAFFDQPELMHRMNAEHADHIINVFRRLTKICVPDFITLAEDMSYNHGPMLSKDLFDEFLAPYYKRVIPAIREHGTKVFVDSDGLVDELVPWLLAAGVNGLLPLERQASVDLPKLRAHYPGLLFLGGFDKMTMSQGESAMRAEFERLVPAARKGGCFIACDHQTPPGVSLDDYRLYLRLFREYAPVTEN